MEQFCGFYVTWGPLKFCPNSFRQRRIHLPRYAIALAGRAGGQWIPDCRQAGGRQGTTPDRVRG